MTRELRIGYPENGAHVEATVVVVYRNSNGSVMIEYEHIINVESEWTVSWRVASWGWDEPGEGDEGAYDVELYLDRELVAAKVCEIYE